MARLTTLLFAMWLGVTVSTVVDLEKRIIGGKKCGSKERLYHVKLKGDNGTHESKCGGSLISNQWILTSAHCYEPGWTYTAHVHRFLFNKRMKIRDPPEIFNDSTGQQHDLMLLKLPEAVGNTHVGRPNCTDPPNIGDTVQVAGHASTKVDLNNKILPGSSTTLQCADMNITDCQDLISRLDRTHYQELQHEQWICAFRDRVDICHGDSGGGLVYKNKIYGVIARGDLEKLCAIPAVFMDLCHPPYFDWIQDTIKQP